MIKVFGHKSPDTDAVLSAIVYAWVLKTKQNIDATAYVNGELNKEAKFVLEHFGISAPEKLPDIQKDEQVVIVDTNNPEELPANITDARIIDIIDHHKLSGLSTALPLNVTLRPLASTTSVIFTHFLNSQTEGVDKGILGLILAGILSDTLEFRSPTTTEIDKTNATLIATALGINMTDLATQMFVAKSDLTGYSAKDILLSDSKVFEIKGKKLRISALETTLPSAALSQKDAIKAEMEAQKTTEGLDEVLFFVIDILKEVATLLVTTDSAKTMCETAFNTKFAEGADSVELPGVLSRKKQIIPALEK
ncbi:manganese-dependent inorganic pyrophosphatase [bacterium]|nr:manganese-dependent inorganic pyrophosphatase [bacterium]